jgi:hypothetical protein
MRSGPRASERRTGCLSGTPTPAGQRSAILYSLIVSCQRHDKDPMAYMKDIIARLRMTNRDDLRALTPRLWQPAAL